MEHNTLESIRNAIESKDAECTGQLGPLDEEIYTIKNGIYQPTGKLMLPFSVEGRREVSDDEQRSAVVFTHFSPLYFSGGEVRSKDGNEYSDHCDWNETYEGPGFLFETDVYSKEPSEVIRTHVANFLNSRENLRKVAEETNVSDVFRQAFMLYEK